MKNEIAVLISDIHFKLETLELASSALSAAVEASNVKSIPLIICGDLLDQKPIIRAECANKIIEILQLAKQKVFILVGNHDLINESGKAHSLNFLKPYAMVIEAPTPLLGNITLFPYYSDVEELRQILKTIPKKSTLIMHQGMLNADMGHYIQDKSALSPEDVKDFRVISGHYHKSQDIICSYNPAGQVGIFSYVGNPYTLNNSEASHTEKGLKILMGGGALAFLPLNLRKHVVFSFDINNLPSEKLANNSKDLITIKISCPSHQIHLVDKKILGGRLLGHTEYKLDLNITSAVLTDIGLEIELLTEGEILDSLLDSSNLDKSTISLLKSDWKELLK